jgi:glutamate carboxypeptidase
VVVARSLARGAGANASEVLGYLCRRREAMVSLLLELVAAESPSGEPKSQEAVLDLLGESLAGIGYRVVRVGGWGSHLYARPRSRPRYAPVQLLLGHCDTVWPLGTVAEMPVGASGGMIRGPGIYDMKAGLVQLVFALEALFTLYLAPPVSPVIFVNSDEERGSRGSTRYIRRLARISDRAFVMEPSLGPEGRLKTARKGVGRFSVEVEGRAAHAGLDPGGGASAVLELSYIIQELFALNDPARGVTVNVGTVDGGTSPNVVAQRCSAVVDVRAPTPEDARRVEESILSLQPATPGVRLSVSGGMGRPPMERTPRNRRLWGLARRLGGDLGLHLEEAMAGGGSDGSTTSLYTATLDGLGAVGDGAHARHEFVYETPMIARAALLALLVLAPALGKEPE